MKVIHAIFTFTTGGSETLLVDIINRQCQENSVSLIVIKDLVNHDLLKSIDRRVNVFLLGQKGNPKRHFLSLFLKINAIVAPIHPDAIHCHDNTLFPFFIRWKRKTILTVHNVGLSVSFLKQYQKVFAVSRAVQEDVKQRTGIEPLVIYNGIKIVEYLPRTNYQINDREVFKVVQLSRLCLEQKGQDIAIQALHLLKKQHPKINIRLDFVGDGNALPQLQALVKHHHLPNEVIFVGQVNRDWVKKQLQDYHLLIQPSRHEGFGLTIVEGFACGLPVIASDLDGPKEIIERLHAGLLVAPDDPQALADAIFQVYETYRSAILPNTYYLIQNKEHLAIFDVCTTTQAYLENYP